MTIPEYEQLVEQLAAKIEASFEGGVLYGIPTGGTRVADSLMVHLGNNWKLTYQADKATLIVDDLVDSGKTLARYSGLPSAVLIRKPHTTVEPTLFVEQRNDWVIFPWEDDGPTDAVIRLIEFTGDNPNREGLQDTPKRVIKMYQELFSGYQQVQAALFKAVFTSDADQMVVVKDIPFYSTCEHHMVPFFGTVDIGYLPSGKVLGLSKFARLVDMFSRRLQIQEQLTDQIATSINENLHPLGVMVVVRAQHLCMAMRGVKKPGAETVTSITLGQFRENAAARAEFLAL